ncbi:Vitamin B12-dependent ribonucleoside-diphosphate reductase [Tepidimonas sediminis]|uniref:Vitamin B12-dependent ribonucleotide reductase n=1 Tax=Tepidimonas sediminis TaxID=2588941 RepID=A0A554WUU1_9BURK|nr:adenosylcobalamin-dependent ribonucleoside-diphosphate reductase [Tepidimonas sediminis]TSE27344.1 Vitamin B12-dependent ribonucleoside-diphosphate reductase [Tepidimonas sediminis]
MDCTPADEVLPPLPPQPISVEVLRQRYFAPGERGPDDLFGRVARAVAAAEPADRRIMWARRFRQHLAAGAIGAGRIMSAAGRGTPATLVNCFVQPLGDALHGTDADGYPGLEAALREAGETLRLGGGVGCDFSRVRPRDARPDPTAPTGGPCACVDAFERMASAVAGDGVRPGAQMAVLRIDHPDVLEFVTAKRTPGRWSPFNVSVAVPDAFIEAVQAGAEWELMHRAEPSDERKAAGAARRADGLWVYRRVPARALWEALTRAAYDCAEPGVLFLDAIQRDNNLRAIERIEATNPCGEQPLPPYGGCCLGPLILPRFVRHPFGHGGPAQLDFDALAQAVAVQVRLLDDVLDVTPWPLPQQQAEARAKRRIGVGFTGLGDALIMLGLRYDRDDGRAMASRIARTMRDAAYRASVALAREKGAYPLFDADAVLAEGTFASRLPDDLKAAIRAHGLRNSHLLSIAPTGTVSLAFADNTSNGIEPAFAWTYTRRKREADGHVRVHEVQDHAWRLYRALHGPQAPLTEAFVSALEIAPADHVAMVAAVQPFVDAGISKTVNVPADCPSEAFRDLYLQAWRAGLKGLTTYRPNAVVGSVLDPVPRAAQAPSPAPAREPVEACAGCGGARCGACGQRTVFD